MTRLKVFCPLCQCRAEEHPDRRPSHDYQCYNEKCPLDHFTLVTRKSLGLRTTRDGTLLEGLEA